MYILLYNKLIKSTYRLSLQLSWVPLFIYVTSVISVVTLGKCLRAYSLRYDNPRGGAVLRRQHWPPIKPRWCGG